MSIKPRTPDHDRRLGRQMGRERARLDQNQGIRQQSAEQLWRPHTASPDYVAGLWEGYQEIMDGRPSHLEDFA